MKTGKHPNKEWIWFAHLWDIQFIKEQTDRIYSRDWCWPWNRKENSLKSTLGEKKELFHWTLRMPHTAQEHFLQLCLTKQTNFSFRQKMFSHQSVVQGKMKQQSMIRPWISIFTSQTLKLLDPWSNWVTEKPSYVLELVRIWVVNSRMCMDSLISYQILYIRSVHCEKSKHCLKKL